MSGSAVITSITATTTEVFVLTTSTSQRKGEKPHNHKNATATAGTSLADTNGNGSAPGLTEHRHDPALSPTGEHVLIAAGTIGKELRSCCYKLHY